MSAPITLHAILVRVSTTADGGWRVTLDVPQSDADQVMRLSALRDCALGVAIVPETDSQGLNREKTEERPIW